MRIDVSARPPLTATPRNAANLALDVCPACEAVESRLVCVAQASSFVMCLQCRLLRLDGGVPAAQRPDRSSHWLPWPQFWWGRQVRFTREALPERSAGSRTLLLGGGIDSFAHLLQRAGLLAIQLSPQWRPAQSPAVVGRLVPSPVLPGSLDAVWLVEELDRRDDPASLLDQVAPLLKPEGRLLLQIANAQSWQLLLFGGRWRALDPPHRALLFRPSDIDALLNACGFEVLRQEYAARYPSAAWAATSLLPSWEGDRRWWRRAVLLVMTVGLLPFAALEAACAQGSTLLIEARKQSAA